MYELYYLPTCPFCQKVLDFIKEENINISLKDITEPDNEKALIEKGGKRQVPFLVDDDTTMYESDAIIEHLRKHGRKSCIVG